MVSVDLFGQAWVSDENNFETNWNITLQVGTTALLSEINTDLGGTSNDMNNQADWGFNFQIAKMVWERFDVGLEFGISNFKGFKNYSSNVNWLNLHTEFNNADVDFQPFAIYYDSDVTNFTLYTKYNFINFNKFSQGYIKLNIYAKLGLGVLFPSVEMGYKDLTSYEFTGLTHPLYIKGRYPEPVKDAHFIFHPALGLNYQLSDRIFLSVESSFQFMSADNIDGIHNFSNLLTPDISNELTPLYRIRVYTMTAKFMLGATYFFNFDTHRQMRKQQMPWFANRYSSYYSKYQNVTSRKDRQERLPFFRDKFTSEE